MQFEFIGWCKDDATNTDKVWCVLKLNGDEFNSSYATVWGRRGHALQHKIFKDVETVERSRGIYYSSELGSVINTKLKKYTEVDASKLDEIYPEFKEDLEKTAVWAILSL